ncbi:MAG: hypothetical protein ABI411_12570 [Tahibacter sp.]
MRHTFYLPVILYLLISTFIPTMSRAGSYGSTVPAACVATIDDSQRVPGTTPSWSVFGPLSTLLASDGAPVPIPPVIVSFGTRQVRYSAWRIACDTSHAALMLTIEDWFRKTEPDNLMLPRIVAVQDGASIELHATVPNDTERLSPGMIGAIKGVNSFVLVSDDSALDTDQAFELQVNDAATAQESAHLSIPAFNPTPASYPDAVGPRPINGRYAGNFFDPAKPGEGIIVEIGDSGPGDQHFLQFAWHSFDNSGAPFWISGGISFTGNARHLHMPAAYRGGGRFGGVAAAQSQTPWGSVDIEFSDCHTAVIDYSALGNLPADVPGGSGHLQWQRLTGISGYSCD